MRKIKDIIENRVDKLEQKKVDMFNSLLNSVKLAGGSDEMIKEDVLDGMTVLELIDILGVNNIVFTYIAQKPKFTANFDFGEHYDRF